VSNGNGGVPKASLEKEKHEKESKLVKGQITK
jgi:hypothetical protein